MVLEVTAWDEKGQEIFAQDHTYQMVGYDSKGERTYDAWAVRNIIDTNILKPDNTDVKFFSFSVPKGNTWLRVEAFLYYQIVPTAEPVLMTQVKKRIELKK